MNRTAGSQKSVLAKKKHLLYPNLVFEKRLDVRQDENILNFWMGMAQAGWVSPRTVVQGSGLDYDSEMATIGQDAGQIARNQLLMQSLGIGEEGGAGGAGSPMGGVGIGSVAGEGLGGLGREGGEGKVPPGGAGGTEGPASKATFDFLRRRITASELPPNIKAEIDVLLKDNSSIDLFVKGE